MTDRDTLLILDPVAESRTEFRGKTGRKVAEIAVQQLQQEMEKLCSQVATIAEGAKSKEKGIGLAEIEIAVGISASGKFCIFGSGTEAAAEASITLRFAVSQ
jgi:hypothetical protein